MVKRQAASVPVPSCEGPTSAATTSKEHIQAETASAAAGAEGRAPERASSAKAAADNGKKPVGAETLGLGYMSGSDSESDDGSGGDV